jgi:acylphosphatase
MDLREYTVHFSGYVHGVGFRFTAAHVSRRFSGLTGYVRNLPDGRVEILAECEENVFKRFLNDITEESSLKRYIQETKFQSKPIEKRKYNLFDINV